MNPNSDRMLFARRQRWFFELLSDLDPLPRAVEAHALREPSALPLARWLRAEDERSAARALEIYRDMRFFRLVESLQQDFPSARAWLGADEFAALVRAYLRARPSSAPSLRDLGAAFPHFVRDYESGRDDLADLCALDWARLSAFDATDVSALDPTTLAEIPPERWSELELRLIPGARTLQLSHAVEAAWLALDRGDAAPASEARAQSLLVWKWGFDVRHRVIAEWELGCASALRSGLSLQALCERFAEAAPPDPAGPAAFVFAQLRQWSVDGLLLRS
jgi:hypothetical protein